jgi:hypothetical protein
VLLPHPGRPAGPGLLAAGQLCRERVLDHVLDGWGDGFLVLHLFLVGGGRELHRDLLHRR